MDDAELEQLRRLIRTEVRKAFHAVPRKTIKLCEDCGHRHLAGYCSEVCPTCIEEEN